MDTVAAKQFGKMRADGKERHFNNGARTQKEADGRLGIRPYSQLLEGIWAGVSLLPQTQFCLSPEDKRSAFVLRSRRKLRKDP